MESFLSDLSNYGSNYVEIREKYASLGFKKLQEIEEAFQNIYRAYYEGCMTARNCEEALNEKKSSLEEFINKNEGIKVELESDFIIAKNQVETFKAEIEDLQRKSLKIQEVLIEEGDISLEEQAELEANEIKSEYFMHIKKDVKHKYNKFKKNLEKAPKSKELPLTKFKETISTKINKYEMKIEEIDQAFYPLPSKMESYNFTLNELKEKKQALIKAKSIKEAKDRQKIIQIKESSESNMEKDFIEKTFLKNQQKIKKKMVSLKQKLDDNEKTVKRLFEENQAEKKRSKLGSDELIALNYEQKIAKNKTNIDLLKLENQMIKTKLEFYKNYMPIKDQIMPSEFVFLEKQEDNDIEEKAPNIEKEEASLEKKERELKVIIEKMKRSLQEYYNMKEAGKMMKTLKKEYYQEKLEFYEGMRDKIEGSEKYDEKKKNDRIKNLQLELPKRKMKHLDEKIKELMETGKKKYNKYDEIVEVLKKEGILLKEKLDGFEKDKIKKNRTIPDELKKKEENIIRISVEMEEISGNRSKLKRKINRMPDLLFLNEKKEMLGTVSDDFNEKARKMKEIAMKCEEYLGFLTDIRKNLVD